LPTPRLDTRPSAAGIPSPCACPLGRRGASAAPAGPRGFPTFLTAEGFRLVGQYIGNARRLLGVDRGSALRMWAMTRRTRDVACLNEPGADSGHPLPAFIKLHDHFLDVPRVNRYGDWEYEWATGPIRFPRHSLRMARVRPLRPIRREATASRWVTRGYRRSGSECLVQQARTTRDAPVPVECAGTDVREVTRITRGPTLRSTTTVRRR
jgi:hypothetical protein